ncbi:multidrug resistance-associated protein 1 [Nadsonia fulvescens var. elongata DSM 6958]|uniref:Multidrug resistance-associated protein 1 n=1 Tax=Nadsonia fulvescens var. elongata DSM 6958 TaxID=857566 RepID=A0A1E3PER4_9ASCO|nr:multidrug resistance-associated protein 1 [Nadsonia fulvescens var. elongata DSM 6958]
MSKFALAAGSQNPFNSMMLFSVSTKGDLDSKLNEKYCFCSNTEGWGPFSYYGDFVPCFNDLVLYVIPSILLLTAGIYQLLYLRSQKLYSSYKGWDFYLKLSLIAIQSMLYVSIALVSVSLFDLKSNPQWYTDIRFFGPILGGFSLVIAATLHYVEQFKGRMATGSLLLYWLLTTLFGSFRLFGLLLREIPLNNGRYLTYTVLISFTTIVSGFIFVLEVTFFNPYEHLSFIYKDTEMNPIDRANFISRITYVWINYLLKLGSARFLDQDDIPKPPAEFSPKKVTASFDKCWKEESLKSNPSLLRALAVCYKWEYFQICILYIFHRLIPYAQPFLLGALINFVNDYNTLNETPPLSRGIIISFGMLLVTVFENLFYSEYYQQAFSIGLKAQTALSSMMVKKTLVLAPQERKDRSTGDLVTMMNTDIGRVYTMPIYINDIWMLPVELFVCLYSLYSLLGPATWAGVAVMVALLPVNGIFAKFQSKHWFNLMDMKDKRSRAATEIFSNIKSLKLYNWESTFIKRSEDIRNKEELSTLKKIYMIGSIGKFFWFSSSFLVALASFGMFTYIQNTPLTASIIFPTLALFEILEMPLSMIPFIITYVFEIRVSIIRLCKFYLASELQDNLVTRLPKTEVIGDLSVKVIGGTFCFDSTDQTSLALNNINFVANKGELSCIIGKVGAGKSTFLQSLTGDLFKKSGIIEVHGKTAYVAQTPWILNATVKDNIVFGNRLDPEFYDRVIEVCALKKDIEMLPDGDETEVGEKGISLSGGQKARISLARAVYSRADIFLFDDPLSAVDEHVQAHLIREVLGPKGILNTKTRILASNTINVLSVANTVFMISGGEFVESGRYEDVIKNIQGSIYQLVKQFGKMHKNDGNGDEVLSSDVTTELQIPVESQNATTLIDTGALVAEEALLMKTLTNITLRRASTTSFIMPKFKDEELQKNKKTGISSEINNKGEVGWSIYGEYAKSLSWGYILLGVFWMFGSSALQVASTFWLKHWSDKNEISGGDTDPFKFLIIYAIIGITSGLFGVLESATLTIFAAMRSAKLLYSRMLRAVVRAPMSFFETTPLGRITNRFSGDISRIDDVLPYTFEYFFIQLFSLISTLCVIIYSAPQTLVLIIPLLLVYISYQKYYIKTSRELKRLISASRSPIFSHFQELITGVSTIRAYARQYRSVDECEGRINNYQKCSYIQTSLNRWLAFRLRLIGAIIIFFTGLMAVLTLSYSTISAGLIGLVMNYAIKVANDLHGVVRNSAEVEANIVAVERVIEYCNLTPERDDVVESNRPPSSWPERGHIQFKNFSTRYRENLDLVLDGIDLEILPKEKVGIVGRTGAGKSSLTLALFRIIEAAGGQILIDDIDISEIGLSDLRSKLSIIPQESQVFVGSIRENLDPAGVYSDSELWRVLELSHLKTHVLSMGRKPDTQVSEDSESRALDASDNVDSQVDADTGYGLDAKVSEGGSNLSAGQKQLMCLCRALLNPSSILILDEATAAVDVETDKIIQETIRNEFKDKTIITIAHRLNTIMDSDKIIALDSGHVVEFDTPVNLMKVPDGVFASLCAAGGFSTE